MVQIKAQATFASNEPGLQDRMVIGAGGCCLLVVVVVGGRSKKSPRLGDGSLRV